MIGKRNKEFLAASNRNYLAEAKGVLNTINPFINKSFTLSVCYPGLVTGVGIGHEAKIEEEFKLGIHLDYTTGLPVIYGSSVKGVLRSAFEVENLMEVLLAVAGPKLKEELDMVGQKLAKRPLKEWSALIFGDNEERESRSAYHRDIFSMQSSPT